MDGSSSIPFRVKTCSSIDLDPSQVRDGRRELDSPMGVGHEFMSASDIRSVFYIYAWQ